MDWHTALILLIVSLAACAIGWWRTVYFISLGYGGAIAALAVTIALRFRERLDLWTTVQLLLLFAYGVRLAGDWFSFTLWLVAADSGAFVAYAVATRGALAWRTWRSRFGGTLLSGALGVSSFGVFMWALGRAPVGPVSALRETSVLFAALIGALFLGEQPSWRRYVAATAIAAGIAVLGLAR